MALACPGCALVFDDTDKGAGKLKTHLEKRHPALSINAINRVWPARYIRMAKCAKCRRLVGLRGTSIVNHVNHCILSQDRALSAEFKYRDFFPHFIFEDPAKNDAYCIERPLVINYPLPGPQMAPQGNLEDLEPEPAPPADDVEEAIVANPNGDLPAEIIEDPIGIAPGNPAIQAPNPGRRRRGPRRGGLPRNPNPAVPNANNGNPIQNAAVPLPLEHGFNFAFDENPSIEQLEELDNLASDLSEGLHYLHHTHVRELRPVVDTILRIHLNPGADACIRKLAVYALLILPGLIVRLQRVKTDRLCDVMRDWKNSVSPVLAILCRARQTLMLYPRRPSRGASRLNAAKAIDLVKAQRLGTLMNAIESSADGPLMATKSLADLRTLADQFHPVGDEHDRIDDILAPPDTADASISTEDLAKAISKLPMSSAAGASGWTFHLLRLLYEGESKKILSGTQQALENSGVGLLKRLLSTITSGTIDNMALRKLNCSRLIFVPKRNGGNRPIAIGDSLLRLLLRVLNAQYAPIVGPKLEPLQVAVGTSGGCEVMAAMAQETFSSGSFTLSLDLHSAFNQVWRRAIAEGLREHAPGLLSIFKLLYGSESELRANAKEGRSMVVGLSARGCKQGDPLSMLYFAVAIHAWLRSVDAMSNARHAELAPHITPFTSGYADDIALGGDPAILCSCLPVISASLANTTGLQVSINKCKLFGAGQFAAPAEVQALSFSDAGSILVGVPIGTAHFVQLESARLLEEAARGARLVTESSLVTAQVKIALLSKCVNARPQYLARNIHPAIISASLMRFDGAIDFSLERILGAPLGPHRAILRGLPFSYAGCGLRRYQGAENINAYNSRLNLVSLFLQKYNHAVPAMQLALDALSAREPVPFPQFEPNHPVTSLREVHQKQFSMVVANIERERDGDVKAAYLRSGFHQGPAESTYSASGKFLAWTGGSDHRWHMSDNIFVSALRRRLCLPESNTALMCPHTRQHDPQGSQVNLATNYAHTLLCRSGTPEAIGLRHKFIVKALLHLISSCCFPENVPLPANAISEEVIVGVRANGSAITADLVVAENVNRQYQTRIVIDVTIVEPNNRHGVGREMPGAAVLAAASDKLVDYAPVIAQANTIFVPFALDSNGHIGTHATGYLNRLKEINPLAGSRIKHFVQEVSYHLAKQTAIAAEAGRAAAYHAVWHRH